MRSRVIGDSVLSCWPGYLCVVVLVVHAIGHFSRRRCRRRAVQELGSTQVRHIGWKNCSNELSDGGFWKTVIPNLLTCLLLPRSFQICKCIYMTRCGSEKTLNHRSIANFKADGLRRLTINSIPTTYHLGWPLFSAKINGKAF